MTRSTVPPPEEEHPYSKRAPPAQLQREDSNTSGHKPIMEWSENFQDLSIFCNLGSKMMDTNTALQSGEQLDTPVITISDGFDFGPRSCSRVSHDTLEESDPWAADLNIQQQQQQQQQYQPPTNPQSLSSSNNSNVKEWKSVADWLCSSPNHSDIDYEPPSTAFSVIDEEKPRVVVEQNYADSSDFRDHIDENKEQAIDIVELLRTTTTTNRAHMFVAGGNSNSYSNSRVAGISNSSTASRKVLRNSLLIRSREKIDDSSLSSIFKLEEPLVVKADQSPSLLGAKNLKPEVIEIGSASPTPRDGLDFDAAFVGIKMEPPDVCEVEEEEEDGVEFSRHQQLRSFKAPVKQVKKLKLDIKSASIAGVGAVMTPTTAGLGESLDTPDVLKPLLEGMPSFDLIKYCEADELANISLPIVTTAASPLVVDSGIKDVMPTAKKQPSYGQKKAIEEEKEERIRTPLSTIKEEDLTTDESSSYHHQPQHHPNSKVLPRKKIIPTRKRRRPNFENFESENSSDNYVDNEDDDETFHLPSKYQAQSAKSKRSRTSSKTSTVSSAGKRKVSSSGIDSDQESIISLDRYRELRDRNNEASKRSRMNRKSREMEMKEMAIVLENKNGRLKARATKLEKLVETFRSAMFKLVTARKD